MSYTPTYNPTEHPRRKSYFTGGNGWPPNQFYYITYENRIIFGTHIKGKFVQEFDKELGHILINEGEDKEDAFDILRSEIAKYILEGKEASRAVFDHISLDQIPLPEGGGFAIQISI
jgi:hypothetical protein